MENYLNPNLSPQERAEDLLSKMELTEKTRQLGCTLALPMIPMEYQDLRGGIGASILMVSNDNAKDIRAMQDYILDHSPHRIPALFHNEALSGTNAVLGGNQYPISIGLGASFDPEMVEEMCEITREQMLANGIRHALSPVADLARDLRWGRTNETYGNDPTLSAAMTVAFVRGMQTEDLKNGVAACGKHFIAYSQPEAGMNMHKTMATNQEIREQFAKPFEAAIQLANLKTMMNAYSAVNGKPVVGSKEVLTDLLRGELGFDGVVVSDYTSIPQLVEPYRMAEDNTDAGIQALKAGMDIECPGRDCYGDGLEQAVRDGRLEESYVDRAVLRILKLKFELGLFENPYPREELLPRAMDSERADRGSYHAAQETMTLLKNDGILPLKDTGKKVAVIGPAGNCLRMLFSHYTAVAGSEMMANLAAEGDTQEGFNLSELMQQGSGEDENANVGDSMLQRESLDKYEVDKLIRKLYPKAKTVFEALQESFSSAAFCEGCDYRGDDRSHFAEAAELARQSDAVILCVGGKSGIGVSATSGEGVDSASLKLPGVQEELMRAVYEANPNLVIVHSDGRPLSSPWAYEHARAILEAWLPNTYGGLAIADVLTGKYNPAGRTPVDVPRSEGHLPVYHYQQNGSSSVHNLHIIKTGYADDSSSVLRPFGYGLSYTDFDYANGKLEDLGDGSIVISVDVKNTGALAGDEVVQLYGSDLCASMIRPIHELIGFKRVSLHAGETKRVSFSFNIDALSFENSDGDWVAEAGRFRFVLGSHSDDIRAEFEYTQKETIKVDPNKRCFFAEAAE